MAGPESRVVGAGQPWVRFFQDEMCLFGQILLPSVRSVERTLLYDKQTVPPVTTYLKE